MALLAGSLVCNPEDQPLALFFLHLACSFATALFCNMELARRRPAVTRLTEFYLTLSLGGAVGAYSTLWSRR